MSYYLQDSGGNNWLLGITDAGAYTTTLTTTLPSSAPVASIALVDTVTSLTWQLSVLTSGALQITAGVGAGVSALPIFTAPSGILSSIVIINGAIATTVITAPSACNFSLSGTLLALAARLYNDVAPFQFWTSDELTLYLFEAMRTWNALTGYWRGDFTFPAAAGTTWYDITSTATAPNTLRPLTLTTTSLYTIIEYHLLEPPVGAGTWQGSSQFALSDIQSAVSRRLNELLGATGCSLTRSLVAATPGRITLPSATLDLRRVAILPATGFGSPSTLWEDDSWAWQAFEPSYTTAPQGIPSTYAQSTSPLLTFDVDATVNVPAQYELLTTQGTPGAAGASLLVPDDWAWVIKWGALADLFGRESNAKDALRQQYCERRYAEGMSLLALAPALLGMRVNNIPMEIDAVRSADQYNTGWEGTAAGAPSIALVAGLNLIALSPQPDSGSYSLTATVIENTPLPTLLTDCINVTEDVYEAILDEAQHLAMLKCGGAEFAATFPMHQRFLSLAALYSSRIAEMGEFAQVLYAQSRLESSMNPRFTADSPAEVLSGE